jgi:hypothetical protein
MGQIKTILYLSFTVAFLSSCSSYYSIHDKPLHRNIPVYFESGGLATTVEASGKMNVYKDRLLVKLKNGSIRINLDHDNDSLYVDRINMSLSKFNSNGR